MLTPALNFRVVINPKGQLPRYAGNSKPAGVTMRGGMLKVCSRSAAPSSADLRHELGGRCSCCMPACLKILSLT